MVNTEVWFKLSEGSNVLLTGSLFDADFSFNYSGPGGIVGNNILSYSSGNVGPGVGIGWSNFLAAGDYYIAAFIEDGTDPDYPDSHGSYEFKLEIVPEPISMVMLGCLGAGMAVARKLRRKKA
jgi:hypothetical protein